MDNKQKLEVLLAQVSRQDLFNIKDYALTLLWEKQSWGAQSTEAAWLESVLTYLIKRDLIKFEKES